MENNEKKTGLAHGFVYRVYFSVGIKSKYLRRMKLGSLLFVFRGWQTSNRTFISFFSLQIFVGQMLKIK